MGEQAVADSEQTLADADQTLSNTDQTGSDRDQTSADSDQFASDHDQAASDRDLADGVDAQQHVARMSPAPASILEDFETGAPIVTVARREFFFDGDLDHWVRYTIDVRSDALIIDLSDVPPLDDIAAAQLRRASRELLHMGVAVFIACPPAGLADDLALHVADRRARTMI